jgi:hypothetical protein
MRKSQNTALVNSPDYLQFIEELKARVVSVRISYSRRNTCFIPSHNRG